MKQMTLAFILGLVASSGFAQGRPQTPNMTCTAAKALVLSQGAIVLGMGRDTFDRVVRDASFCAVGQETLNNFAPTSDNAQCLVGYRCYDPSREAK